MNKADLFLDIFKKAKKKYGKSTYRLAGEGWPSPEHTLLVTIMSAQSRDETTIPIAEDLFKKFPEIKDVAQAKEADILKIFKSLNYNKTKARHVKAAAHYIMHEYNGKISPDIDELIKIPGVGRKTANLIMGECFGKPSICVDTHVHRISNVLGLIKTKDATQTEYALQKIAPEKYWKEINRLFVLWGKDVPGRDKEKLLAALK